MRPVILLCCFFAVSAGALPPDGNIFGMLLVQPFMAEVTTASTSPRGYTLGVRLMDGGNKTLQGIYSHPTLDQHFVAQLKPGRIYAFPQCLVDFLGLDETVRLIRTPPPSRPAFSDYNTPMELMDLGAEHPFRATVLDQDIGETLYSIVLQGANSRLYHARGAFETDTVKSIAEKLRRGETYEFPAVLGDVLLSQEERAAKARPKSPAAAVLARYIGSWTGTIRDDPAAKIQMNCHWLADGTGIWREITFIDEGSEHPPALEIARITYNADTRSYFSANPAPGSPAALSITWDETMQTFTTTLPTLINGEMRSNMATFTAAGRIDWKTVTKDDGGKVLATKRGSYVRTSKKVPAVKLPPAVSKALLTAYATAGKTSPDSKSALTTPPAPGSDSTPSKTDTDFFKLRERPPFRGKITHIQFDDQSITATLERGDLHQFFIHHTPRDQDWAKALVIAKRLTPGSTHEFPAVLADTYEPPPTGFSPLPATEAMHALSPFIGKWSMHWTVGPPRYMGDKMITHYFWSNDGTGLWCETHRPAGTTPPGSTVPSPRPYVEATFISFDPATRNYYEIQSLATSHDSRRVIEWDAQTKTYSYAFKLQPFNSGRQFTSMRRIISRDRIEFHSKVTQADGTVMFERAGYYKLIEP
ncbi:MAG: hypothetical protein B7Z37_26835 [Verrucomicrobia bacterium 12-59-8]|nr:MAG: hypothetical protein B7Z37_26835 [Verrucomicrobia bacterium 12-59-8]